MNKNNYCWFDKNKIYGEIYDELLEDELSMFYKEQNSKIDNMNRAYDEMTKRVEGARTTIQHMNVEAQVKLEALKHYYESIPDSNTCDAIRRILDADIPLVH